MDILTSKESGILTITINRLEKKNALTAAMYQTMVDAMKDGESDASVRVILFVGQSQIFSAGNDIEDFLKNPPNSQSSPVFQFLWQISHASKPLVAAVAGAA
ncbi:enoyl-CoA hydratase-related protein, partial [Glaciimonas sp. CA11.2]